MNLKTAETLRRICHEIMAADEDISTERLLTMTAERGRAELKNNDIDEGHVSEALAMAANAPHQRAR